MNYQKQILSAIAVVFALASSQAMDVSEIVSKASQSAYYQGEDGKAKLSMTITDAQGRERQRELTILRRNDDTGNGDQKFYVYFERPSDVKGTTFLVWKQAQGPDERWLYLPALDLVKRIAASDERTSFVGSHYFYEDVSGRSPVEDNHELVEETDDYYVVKSVPKDPNSVEFASYTSWIHKGTFLAVKIEYADKSGSVYRTYEALDVQQIEGYYTVMKGRMTDQRIGGFTTLEAKAIDYDLGLEDSLFQERSLRTPPRRELR
ncbi:outer membrane lipoprotein-sorting protein [Pelagicoccus sp. SDUM812003]|uniref:outer membrane lipoprotein-sorting protein n=1 Tax=Pelagicoccus sp. SDUM812003 TaxID=3041267 RepID=UPI00280D7FCE|nr:outer membrane lipoprotein-sorting protein [Pelagicoccus sp. SDUM812003]MDQ8204424.1 outer membrane lipoprotein-sorting protein [Pelagicoccus sp. SDUM812003]